MSQSDICIEGYKKEGAVIIPDGLYDEWVKEVMKMPYKKRKQYKNYLIDKRGVKTKVIYKNDMLMSYSEDFRTFVKIEPYSSLQKFKNDGWIAEPTSIMGEIVNCCFDVLDDKDKIDNLLGGLVVKMAEINHTGNHYRNKYVSVGNDVYGSNL